MIPGAESPVASLLPIIFAVATFVSCGGSLKNEYEV